MPSFAQANKEKKEGNVALAAEPEKATSTGAAPSHGSHCCWMALI